MIVPERVLREIYRGNAVDFVAWACRTNANYCRMYGGTVANFGAEVWDRTADALDPERLERGAVVHWEP
jgi:hypothetical protein